MAVPLTADAVLKHPEFPHVVWPLQPTQKGTVTVAQGRGGPITIAYEIHGHGPARLVWIMGLGGFMTGWQRQTKDFGHTNGDKYSCLIFDNRGVGKSDKPVSRYSTSEMAKDTIELIDHVGWTDSRQLNVVGISMGGMIAQEVACLIPSRIASLSLVSTAGGIFNTVGFVENLRNRINLFIPKALDVQLANAKHNMFSNQWLLEPDVSGPRKEYVVEPFPTNGDRFAAGEISKRSDPIGFTRTGFIFQAIAAGWHHKSTAQLHPAVKEIGWERIMIIHGTSDRMITFPHALDLLSKVEGEEGKGRVTTRFIPGQGHVIPIEKRDEFKSWVEEMVERGKEKGEIPADVKERIQQQEKQNRPPTTDYAALVPNGLSRWCPWLKLD